MAVVRWELTLCQVPLELLDRSHNASLSGYCDDLPLEKEETEATNGNSGIRENLWPKSRTPRSLARSLALGKQLRILGNLHYSWGLSFWSFYEKNDSP